MTNFLRKPFKYSFFSASLILIVVNFAIFFITSLFPQLEYQLGFNPVLFLYYHKFWQPFTYMFIHGDFNHILSNMVGLFFFGMTVEKALGSKEFLLLYFLCGILSCFGSLGYFMLTGSYRVFLIGASGALFSVMLAYAVIFPRANIFVWGILPIPSPLLVIIYALIEIFAQIYGVRSNVAHYTHLFGFLAAFLYFEIRMGINPFKIWKSTYFE